MSEITTKTKNWLLTTNGVIGISTLLTSIVLVESIFPPWAPYFIVYAILAILIPSVLKTARFGSFRTALTSHWKIFLGCLVVAVIWDQGIFTQLYEYSLNRLGIGNDPFYSLNTASEILLDAAATKLDITVDSATILYALFVLVWAPIGEELFYRGYIQEVLRDTKGFRVAALVSAAFFGIRHATHLFFLWPNVPLVAAGIWSINAFGGGLLFSYLYEKTNSLYLPMLVHAGTNIVGIIFMGG